MMNSFLTSIYRKDDHSLTVLLSENTSNQRQLELNEALKILVGDNEKNPGRRNRGIENVPNTSLQDADKLKYGQMLLLAGADPNTHSGDGAGPILLQAAEYGDLGFMQLLIEFACNVNAVDEKNRSALHRVVSKVPIDSKTIGILLASGADPNIIDVDGRNPLMTAIHCTGAIELYLHDPEPFDMLLIDTKTETTDDNKRTALHYAVLFGHDCVLEQLLKFGRFNIDSKDTNGDTPLHHAVKQSSSMHKIKLLADAGADLNVRNGEDITPLYAAAKSRCTDNVMTLIQYNAEVPKTYKTENVEQLHLIHSGVNTMALMIMAGHDWDCSTVNYTRPRNFCFCGGPRLPDFNEILTGDIKENWLQRVAFTKTYGSVNPLKHMCRLKIRRLVGSNIMIKLKMLDAPESLKEYISMSDLASVREIFG